MTRAYREMGAVGNRAYREMGVVANRAYRESILQSCRMDFARTARTQPKGEKAELNRELGVYLFRPQRTLRARFPF